MTALNDYDRAIERIAEGCREDFIAYLITHEKLAEAMMDASYDYVTERMPVITEESVIDLAAELLTGVTLIDNKR